MLTLAPGGTSLPGPFIAVKRDRSVQAMLGVAVVNAFVSQLDEVVVQRSGPPSLAQPW